MGGKDGRVAIIGASMAGLLAARGLADIASEVLVIAKLFAKSMRPTRKAG